MTRVRCTAILFDLDGVLVDSHACVERHWAIWAKRHGLDLAEVLAQAHGRRTVDTIRAVAPELDANSEAQTLDEAEASDREGIIALPGSADLVSSLPKGLWAVVTSGTRALALARLGYAGLPMPASLVTADDVAEGKPHPECYAKAARLLSVSPAECIVVEDTPAGVAAAQAASMRAVAVTTTHQREALAKADFCIDTLAAMRVSRLWAATQRTATLELELREVGA
jgi:mannitol-1-/sugar-/sorbitol-6-phosphatase